MEFDEFKVCFKEMMANSDEFFEQFERMREELILAKKKIARLELNERDYNLLYFKADNKMLRETIDENEKLKEALEEFITSPESIKPERKLQVILNLITRTFLQAKETTKLK